MSRNHQIDGEICMIGFRYLKHNSILLSAAKGAKGDAPAPTPVEVEAEVGEKESDGRFSLDFIL